MNNCRLLLSTAYILIGTELVSFGMLDENNWAPKKLKFNQKDQEMMKIWSNLCDATRYISLSDLKAYGKEANKIIEKIPEVNKQGNNLLMGLHIFSFWVDECANFIVSASYKPLLTRHKQYVMDRVLNSAGKDVVTCSYSAADNIYRSLNSKAMIDADIRVLQAARLKRKLGVKSETM
jgi:hypothetical protein